jgi:hypothetical protein
MSPFFSGMARLPMVSKWRQLRGSTRAENLHQKLNAAIGPWGIGAQSGHYIVLLVCHRYNVQTGIRRYNEHTFGHPWLQYVDQTQARIDEIFGEPGQSTCSTSIEDSYVTSIGVSGTSIASCSAHGTRPNYPCNRNTGSRRVCQSAFLHKVGSLIRGIRERKGRVEIILTGEDDHEKRKADLDREKRTWREAIRHARKKVEKTCSSSQQQQHSEITTKNEQFDLHLHDKIQ